MNTWGFCSINTTTFNQGWGGRVEYPRPMRNMVVGYLKTHNLILGTLGYIPGVSIFTGGARVLFGLGLAIGVKSTQKRDAVNGMIIGKFYDESIRTGQAQVVRGLIEMTGLSLFINGAIGTVATVCNVCIIWDAKTKHISAFDKPKVLPHKGPKYRHVFKLMHLV